MAYLKARSQGEITINKVALALDQAFGGEQFGEVGKTIVSTRMCQLTPEE